MSPNVHRKKQFQSQLLRILFVSFDCIFSYAIQPTFGLLNVTSLQTVSTKIENWNLSEQMNQVLKYLRHINNVDMFT